MHEPFIAAIDGIGLSITGGSWGKSIQIWFPHYNRMQSVPLRA